MKRRNFIKAGALFVPATFGIFVPRLLKAQADYTSLLLLGQAPAAGGGACTTSRDSISGTTDFPWEPGSASNMTWMGQKFVAGANYSVCQVRLRIWVGAGSLTGKTFNVHIYSNSSDLPGSSLGSSGATDISSLGGTEQNFDFTFGTPVALTSGTTYWCTGEFQSVDGTNYIRWAMIDGAPGGGGNSVVNSTDGSSWSSTYTAGQLKLNTFST